MALFEDLISGLGGVAQVASGIGTLQQGGVSATATNPPPMPSSAELTNLQLQHALSLANLQQAGYDVTRGPNGEMTLTPRTTSSDVMQSQLGAAGPGLQRELANLGPQTSALGSQLNTQAMAGARGQPQVNRAALIQAIQQKRGPATGLGLQAQGPTPITVGQLSTATPFSNVPSLRSLSRQQTGAAPFLTQTLPSILGGASALAPLLSRLFGGGGGSGGGSGFQGISESNPLMFNNSNDFLPGPIPEDIAALPDTGMSMFNGNEWQWIPDDAFSDFTGNFDYGLGNIFDTSV